MSANSIAAKLSTETFVLSRNAVIGLVHRNYTKLEYPPRLLIEPRQINATRQKNKRKVVVVALAETKVPKMEPEPTTTEEQEPVDPIELEQEVQEPTQEEPVPEFTGYGILALTSRTCKFPVGESDEIGGYDFCCNPTINDSSWCLYHYRMVFNYVPAQRKPAVNPARLRFHR